MSTVREPMFEWAEKRVLVTGASRGLGGGLVRHLAATGAQVVGTARGPVDDDGKCQWVELDLENDSSIAKACSDMAEIGAGPFDVVINNGGVNDRVFKNTTKVFGSLERDNLLREISINSVGPLILIQELSRRSLLKAGGLILNISSDRASQEKVPLHRLEGGNYGYCASKTALNMFSRLMAREAHLGCCVVAIHPGWVKTEMGGEDAPLSTDEAARKIAHFAARLRKEDSGSFMTTDFEVYPF